MTDETRRPPAADDADAALLEALRCAWQPEELADAKLTSLIAQALTSAPLASPVDAAPNPEESAAAEALRLALEQETATPDADLLRALGAASTPAPLSAARHEALLTAALRSAPVPAPSRKRPSVVYATFGAVGAALALAAGFVMLLRPLLSEAPAVARHASDLVPSRSTTALFDQAFERGKTSERIDRIATLRSRDLRANRYRAWGVE